MEIYAKAENIGSEGKRILEGHLLKINSTRRERENYQQKCFQQKHAKKSETRKVFLSS